MASEGGSRVGIRLFYGLIISWLGWTYTVDVATNQARGVDVMEKLADYVGKNYPTSLNEHIHVHLSDVDDEEAVLLVEYNDIK